MTTQSSETRKLLERGTSTYFDAVCALREFRKGILRQSEAALIEKLSKVSAAFGLKELGREDIGQQALPSLDPGAPGEDDYADLCATLELGPNRTLFLGLEWRRDAETGKMEPWAVADIWIKDSDKFWDKARARYPDLRRVGNEIYLEERCPPGQVGKLQTKLERMLDRWCLIWRKKGGIAPITKKA